MQLTRCCFVFLVQGSLYLVSGPRGAARRGGGPEDGGEPGNFLPSPRHPRDGGGSPEAGGEGGSEDRDWPARVNRGGERVRGWPTHSAAGGGRCDQHEGKGQQRGAKVSSTPSRHPGTRGREMEVGGGADHLPGLGPWALL